MATVSKSRSLSRPKSKARLTASAVVKAITANSPDPLAGREENLKAACKVRTADLPSMRGQLIDALIVAEGNRSVVAQKLRVTHTTLCRWLERLGIPSDFGRPPRDREAMLQAIAQHGSKTAAARALDVSVKTINERLAKNLLPNGIKLDPIPVSHCNCKPVAPEVAAKVLQMFAQDVPFTIVDEAALETGTNGSTLPMPQSLHAAAEHLATVMEWPRGRAAELKEAHERLKLALTAAEHSVRSMANVELYKADLDAVVIHLPPRVKLLLRRNPGTVIVAGGFIRACIAREEPNDVDIFTATPALAKALAVELAGGSDIHTTANAYTVKGERYPVQFIHRWSYATPAEALQAFDFTIAKASIWWNENGGKGTWGSLCDSRFYPDLAAKRLVYCAPERDEEAGASTLRVLKFTARGYRAPVDSLGLCLTRLMASAGHKLGIEPDRMPAAELAKVLTELLVEVDPQVDPDHKCHE